MRIDYAWSCRHLQIDGHRLLHAIDTYTGVHYNTIFYGVGRTQQKELGLFIRKKRLERWQPKYARKNYGIFFSNKGRLNWNIRVIRIQRVITISTYPIEAKFISKIFIISYPGYSRIQRRRAGKIQKLYSKPP